MSEADQDRIFEEKNNHCDDRHFHEKICVKVGSLCLNYDKLYYYDPKMITWLLQRFNDSMFEDQLQWMKIEKQFPPQSPESMKKFPYKADEMIPHQPYNKSGFIKLNSDIKNKIIFTQMMQELSCQATDVYSFGTLLYFLMTGDITLIALNKQVETKYKVRQESKIAQDYIPGMEIEYDADDELFDMSSNNTSEHNFQVGAPAAAGSNSYPNFAGARKNSVPTRSRLNSREIKSRKFSQGSLKNEITQDLKHGRPPFANLVRRESALTQPSTDSTSDYINSQHDRIVVGPKSEHLSLEIEEEDHDLFDTYDMENDQCCPMYCAAH